MSENTKVTLCASCPQYAEMNRAHNSGVCRHKGGPRWTKSIETIDSFPWSDPNSVYPMGCPLDPTPRKRPPPRQRPQKRRGPKVIRVRDTDPPKRKRK